MTTSSATTTNGDTNRGARLLLGIGLPLIIIAVALPWFLLADTLPDAVASHFDLGGQPNRSSSTSTFLVEFGAMAMVGIALCVASAFFGRRMLRPIAMVAPLLGGFFGGIGASILAVTAITHRDLAVWTDARVSGWWLLAVAAVATALSVAGARAGTRLPVSEPPPLAATGPAADLNLGEGERIVWAATQNAPWVLGVSLLLISTGVAFAVLASWLFVFFVIIGIGVSALATVHVRADFEGLHVRYGFLPWPTTHLAIDRIKTANVLDVRPLDWGGWGYRGSLKLMDQAAVVHRAGPGLRLDLVDGKVFVITVDDPDGAVAVLNAARREGVSKVSR